MRIITPLLGLNSSIPDGIITRICNDLLKKSFGPNCIALRDCNGWLGKCPNWSISNVAKCRELSYSRFVFMMRRNSPGLEEKEQRLKERLDVCQASYDELNELLKEGLQPQKNADGESKEAIKLLERIIKATEKKNTKINKLIISLNNELLQTQEEKSFLDQKGISLTSKPGAEEEEEEGLWKKLRNAVSSKKIGFLVEKPTSISFSNSESAIVTVKISPTNLWGASPRDSKITQDLFVLSSGGKKGKMEMKLSIEEGEEGKLRIMLNGMVNGKALESPVKEKKEKDVDEENMYVEFSRGDMKDVLILLVISEDRVSFTMKVPAEGSPPEFKHFTLDETFSSDGFILDPIPGGDKLVKSEVYLEYQKSIIPKSKIIIKKK